MNRRLALAGLAVALLGAWLLRRTVLSFDLDQTGPEHVVMRDLARLRVAVEDYHWTNKKWPEKLEDAKAELPKSAKWGYRPEDGHVFVDSTHTDSRGNAWNAY